MLHTALREWTDLDQHSRFRNAVPNRIIRADDIANGEYDGVAGDEFHPGVTRHAVYIDRVASPAQRYEVKLVFYIHPVGAGAITLHSAGASTVRGRLLDTAGALTTTADDAYDVAGGFLTHYCETSSFIGSTVAQEPVWATTLNEGDGIWLVESGRYEGAADAAIAADLPLITSTITGADGGVLAARTAITSQAEIQETITGVSGKCIGRSLAVAAGAPLMVDMILALPPKAVRTE